MNLDMGPPQPMPEHLWGKQWQFVGLQAQDLEGGLCQRPIPIQVIPAVLCPSNHHLPDTMLIPGLVLDGGRSAMRLARWLQAQQPDSLIVRSGQPSGVVLLTKKGGRWVMVTYDDAEVAAAAALFNQRLTVSKGLHFLLVQPDNSGVTYTGLWLLKREE